MSAEFEFCATCGEPEYRCTCKPTTPKATPRLTLRERIAEALWNNEIAESRLKGDTKIQYAKWPEDSATQPYCQSLYRAADAVLAALGSEGLEQVQSSLPTKQTTLRCQERSAECGQCELRLGHEGKHLAGYLMWVRP